MSEYKNLFNQQFSWSLSQPNNSAWAFSESYFSPLESRQIIEQGLMLPSFEATINTGETRNVNESIRRNRVSFFDANRHESHWLFQRVQGIVWSLNQQFFNFSIHYLECLQFTQYNQVGDFYTAHMDMRPNAQEQRKLSISIQLSDPDHYLGSNLELLRCGDEWDVAPRAQGTVVIFPSYHIHRVTELLSGTRYSLVAWVIGPSFK